MAGISYEYHSNNHEASHIYLKPAIDRLMADVPRGATVLDLISG
jgi:hypothetical protein